MRTGTLHSTRVAAVGLLASWSLHAGAELPDPTRPAILPVQAATAAAPDGEPAWVLQSVLLGAGGVRAAVISGQLVKAGERLGDARLLRVTERSAVLQGPQGLVTLFLIADVDKRELRAAPARPAAAAAPGPTPSSTSSPAVPQAAPSRLAELNP